MDINEIKEKFNGLDVCEQRDSRQDYYEIVFYVKDSERWEELLCGLFGPPAKPAPAKPSREDSKLTRNFGGIFKGQTLFRKELPESITIAMLWPWQDNEHITLKIAIIPK